MNRREILKNAFLLSLAAIAPGQNVDEAAAEMTETVGDEDQHKEIKVMLDADALGISEMVVLELAREDTDEPPIL